MANPDHVELVRRGANEIGRWQQTNPGIYLDLSGADLQGISLSSVDLSGADLRRADLRSVDLRDAYLKGANIRGANLLEAHLARANLQNLKGAGHALHLETVLLGEGDTRNFETCERQYADRWFHWEHLRTVGRLPLFGATYTALILLPIIFYGLAIYNDKVDLVRMWAEQTAPLPHHPMHEIATVVKNRFHRQPIPSLSFCLLISTFLLAVAASLYTFFCPPIIKDFSDGQWVYQLSRPRLHYWALAWKWRWVRLTCAACYLFGGLGVLLVLGTKVWNAAWFILANSDFPWHRL